MANYSTTKLTPGSTTKFPANNGNTPGYVEGADLTTKAEFNDAINAIISNAVILKDTETNINDMKESGIYYCINVVNAPYQYGVLIVFKAYTWSVQLWFTMNSTSMKHRIYNGDTDTWYDWA